MENVKDVPKDTTVVDVKKTTVTDGEYTAEIIRDYDGKIDIFYLNKKDPNYAYRFLRNEFKNLSIKTGNVLLQKGGWQIVPKEHLLRTGICKEGETDANGHYIVGDTILAFIPKSLYDEKEADKREKTLAPKRSVERLLKHGDKSIGGKIHPSLQGIQTKDDLKGNWK